MGVTLSLGEVNYRIYLTVTEINNHVDAEIALEDLKADLKALRKVRNAYAEALRKFEEEAYALRAYYARLIRELNDTTSLRNKPHGVRQCFHDDSTRSLTREISFLMDSAKSPSLSPPQPTIPKARYPDKGYLYKLKSGWRKRHLHLHGSSHSTLANGEAHLEQVNQILMAKRQASLGVQRAIRATKENIKLEKEAIDELKTILCSPPRHIYEEMYNRYHELLNARAESSGMGGRIKTETFDSFMPESSTFRSVASHSAASMCSR